jgi:hypothetical protein
MDSLCVVLTYGSSSCSLLTGEDCALGRGAPDQPAELRLSAALDLSRRAAVVDHASPGRWAVRAMSAKNGIVVRHPSGSVIQVPSEQRLEMPDWFDDAYLVVTTPSAEHEVRVQVTSGPIARREAPVSAGSNASTRVVLPRDPARADFRTALCLCEPMLDDPFNRRVPPEGEIAARLTALGLEDADIAARTVERRLARLRERLQVSSNAELRDRLVAACLVTRDALDGIRRRKPDELRSGS